MQNRILSLALSLLLVLALCACGSPSPSAPAQEAPAPTAAPAPETQAPAPTQAPAAETPAAEAPDARPALPDAGLHEAEAPAAGSAEIAARRELALSFVNQDAAALIEALGEPLERSYAPSCLGSGQDGELTYEGFTVYTYREGDRETVKDVA